jgi:hypothetical protein
LLLFCSASWKDFSCNSHCFWVINFCLKFELNYACFTLKTYYNNCGNSKLLFRFVFLILKLFFELFLKRINSLMYEILLLQKKPIFWRKAKLIKKRKLIVLMLVNVATKFNGYHSSKNSNQKWTFDFWCFMCFRYFISFWCFICFLMFLVFHIFWCFTCSWCFVCFRCFRCFRTNCIFS